MGSLFAFFNKVRYKYSNVDVDLMVEGAIGVFEIVF